MELLLRGCLGTTWILIGKGVGEEEEESRRQNDGYRLVRKMIWMAFMCRLWSQLGNWLREEKVRATTISDAV